jgi:threonyl-tRNA synthetase
MGRQINYYMELDSFKLLAQKALDLGFKIIKQLSVPSDNGKYHGEYKEYLSLDKIDFSNPSERYYFYLEEAGEIVFRNGFIESHKSPVIEAGYSKISNNMISRNRLWVSTGYWDDIGTFIKRQDILDKKYSSLARYVKKLVSYTKIPVRFPNGSTYIAKEYITLYLLNLINTTQYECVN